MKSEVRIVYIPEFFALVQELALTLNGCFSKSDRYESLTTCLQLQLDAALRAAEEAQSSLRREQEKARSSLYSDEEFKSLQAQVFMREISHLKLCFLRFFKYIPWIQMCGSFFGQVREINLMRESNSQLREENRRNFEDSRVCMKRVSSKFNCVRFTSLLGAITFLCFSWSAFSKLIKTMRGLCRNLEKR